MKKQTKILLLTGAIIVAIGLMVCVAGAVIAKLNDDQLFAAKTEMGKGYTYSFSGEDITKVDIDVTNASVNIIGGSEESKIELFNFNENFYSFNCSNRLINFKESPDVSSLLRFWESGFTFKGMRYLIQFGRNDGEKTVNIYLTEEDYVKNFTVNTGKGKIKVSDLSTSTDYKFTLENGTVTMENVATDSVISVSAPTSSDCDYVFNNVSAKTFNISASQADIKSMALAFEQGDLDITHGSAQIDFIPKSEYFKLYVNANGKLTVNDASFLSSYKFEKLPQVDPDATEDTKTAEIANITIDGRELAVFLRGDCFAESLNETEE